MLVWRLGCLTETERHLTQLICEFLKSWDRALTVFIVVALPSIAMGDLPHASRR